MKQLIARYDTEWKARLAAIARDVSAATTAPAYAYAVDEPQGAAAGAAVVQLNAGGNYVEHTEGIAAQQQRAGGGAGSAPASPATSAPGIWERKPGDTRDNPYLFQKSPTVVIGATDPIVDAARPHEHRFRVRVRRRHRQAGQVRAGRQRRRLHLRLHRAASTSRIAAAAAIARWAARTG